jgi:hypothetical protein
MLIATWILAGATVVAALATLVLAVSGPVALFAWLSSRREDQERRQREHDEEARNRLMGDISAKYVSRETVGGAVALGIIGTVVGVLMWLDGRKPKA